MRDYAKVSPQFWTRGSGKRLRGDADAQVLALYLVTCPSANMIGVYYVPIVAIAHETGLGLDRTRAAIRSLTAAGFAFYDDDAELAWVPNMARYQIGDELRVNDLRRKGVVAELEKLGTHPFVARFWAEYGDAYQLGPSPVADEAPCKPLASPFEGGARVPPSPFEGGEPSLRRAGAGEEQEKSRRGPGDEPAAPDLPVEESSTQPTTTRSRSPRAARLAADWQPTAELVARWQKRGVDAAGHVEEFVSHWIGEGKPKADWDATFNGFLIKIQGWGRAKPWYAPVVPIAPSPLTEAENAAFAEQAMALTASFVAERKLQ